MSTKVNARSPIYLNYAEPSVPQPALNCDTALGASFCMEISERGIVTIDAPDFGFIVSYTSTDSGFSCGKYADVTSPTTRTVSLKIAIPTGFLNSADNFLTCAVTATQPAFVAGSTCTSRIVPNGSMTAVSIAKGGASSAAQSTAGKFTLNGDTITGFTFFESDSSLFTVSSTIDSGTDINIIVTSNTTCGSGCLYVVPTVSDSSSCQAFQTITVNITGCGAFACSDAPLSGGVIDPDGTISTKPISSAFSATTNNISSDASGSPIITSYSANTTGSARDVTLYYKLTIPSNFTSAGGDKWCPHTITQQSSGNLPAFTYADANHYDYGIDDSGNIITGAVMLGNIESYDPVGVDGMRFAAVTQATTRQVDFVIKSPNDSSKYSNPNTNINPYRVSMVQPPNLSPCASATHTWYISQGFQKGEVNGYLTVFGICSAPYSVSTEVKTSVAFANVVPGTVICDNNSNFKNGQYFAYVIAEQPTVITGASGSGQFYVITIGSNGVISQISPFTCIGGTAYGQSI